MRELEGIVGESMNEKKEKRRRKFGRNSRERERKK